MSVSVIQPHALYELIKSDSTVELIDVRTSREFEDVHASCAQLVPLDTLNPSAVIKARNGNEGKPLYVICKSGMRARQACEKFIAAGYNNVINVDGGTLAWEQAGLPVIRGKKAMSVDCQVRVAMGSMVLLGAALTILVHPAFVGMCAFVGCGMIYAGIADDCPMGTLIAALPWNRNGQGASCAIKQ